MHILENKTASKWVNLFIIFEDYIHSIDKQK